MGALLLFLFLFALIPSFLVWNEWRVVYALWKNGVTAPVEVRYHWMTKMGLMKVYYVIYEFEALDENEEPLFFSRHAEISAEQYRALLEGETLQVCYAAHHPATFRLEGQPSNRWNLTFGAIVAWAYFIFIALVTI